MGFLMGCFIHLIATVVCVLGLKASQVPDFVNALRFYRGCLLCLFLSSAETMLLVALHFSSSKGNIDSNEEETESLLLGMDFFLRACLFVLVWITSRTFYLVVCRSEGVGRAVTTTGTTN